MPAARKFGATIICIFSVVLTPPAKAWLPYSVIAIILIIISLVSRIPLRTLSKRLLIVEPFIIGLALFALLQKKGLLMFVTILTKSTICLFCMILLNSTTRFSDLLRVLQHCHVPSVFITILMLMYRYLFVLFDEMSRMSRARQSRTFTKRRAKVWQMVATTAGHLFVRASKKAERIYMAMCARGWQT
jgi:cobalt/nickel transport system permease protein